MEDASWVRETLPPVEPVRLRSEPDYYGASWLIARGAGRPSPPRSFAAWIHGWPEIPLEHPRELAGWAHSDDMHLVATPEHAAFLRAHGVSRCEAIGAPFVYVDEPAPPRRSRSLLVMPPHSLAESTHDWDGAAYAKLVREAAAGFDTVVACVSAPCWRNGYWKDAFLAAGIDVLVGADIADRNALVRMFRILSSFETMTTNTLGSHVPYAAYAGCKIAVFGPFPPRRREDLAGAPFYVAFPELLDRYMEHQSEPAMRQRHGHLFAHPAEAVDARAWGARELGADRRRPAAEVAQLLGWTVRETLAGYARLPLRRMQHALLLARGRLGARAGRRAEST